VPHPPRRPDPEPLRTNDMVTVAVGTGMWLLAFLVMLPFHASLSHHGHGWWLQTALAGFVLGLLGLGYVRRRQAAIERDAAPTRSEPPLREPGT
jgi:hypothetical protein